MMRGYAVAPATMIFGPFPQRDVAHLVEVDALV